MERLYVNVQHIQLAFEIRFGEIAENAVPRVVYQNIDIILAHLFIKREHLIFL